MELRNINTFLKIAELQSFSRAAEQIGYSQSTVTAQIQALEKELDVRLFDRFNKTVRLTPQGERFLGYAQKLMRTAEEAKADMKKETALSGPLHIAMAPSVCTTYFPRILSLYHERYPDVTLRVDTNNTDRLFDKLIHNEADFVYTFDRRIFHNELMILLEHEEPVYFVAEHGSYPADKQFSLKELLEEPLLLTVAGTSYRSHLDELLASHSLEAHPVLELGQPHMLLDLVRQGTGISFLPSYVIQDAVLSGEIDVLRVPDCRISEWRQVLCHRSKWITPQMDAMIEILKEMCAATPELI